MRITKMRQVLGVFSALVLGAMSAGSVLAAESRARSFSEDAKIANAAFLDKKVEAGLLALKKAADAGDIHASMRIAEVYSDGKLVSRDQVKACEIYSAVAERNEKVDRFSPDVELVAKAFRLYAGCYVEGLSAPGWQKNMRAAADLYFHAGVILQDPESLFELAKLYLHGEVIAQNTAMAIHLLDSGARKQYPPAQALLGSMMWDGKVMKRRAAPGLALLMLAKERASAENQAWIRTLYDDAMITASKEAEQDALLLVEKWKDVHGDNVEIAKSPPQEPEIPAPSKSPARQLGGVEFAGQKDRFQNQNTNTITPLDTGSTK
jgi:hypothetical protein